MNFLFAFSYRLRSKISRIDWIDLSRNPKRSPLPPLPPIHPSHTSQPSHRGVKLHPQTSQNQDHLVTIVSSTTLLLYTKTVWLHCYSVTLWYFLWVVVTSRTRSLKMVSILQSLVKPRSQYDAGAYKPGSQYDAGAYKPGSQYDAGAYKPGLQ